MSSCNGVSRLASSSGQEILTWHQTGTRVFVVGHKDMVANLSQFLRSPDDF